MGRIRDAVVTGARAAARIPIPSALTHQALREARSPQPPSHVLKSHAIEQEMIGRTRTVWLDRHHRGNGLIIHLHGGAYVQGESRQTWEWLEEVARRAGTAAAMIHYRLAPRHRYPAAVDDVLRALADMQRETVLRPGRWVLSGDSAGAGLALAVAQTLAATGVDAPAALLLESPWSDLSREDHGEESLKVAARLYAGAVPRTEPRLSPALGDLTGLPPVHLVGGDRDPLVHDGRRLIAALAEAVGVTPVNISVLKNDRAKAIRFSTLTAICDVLGCQVGDLLSVAGEPA